MTSPSDPQIRRYVGQRIRARRRALNMTQKQLAEELGLTFQQIQRYEKGLDRIAVERLYEIATALDTTPAHFFPACDGGVSTTGEFADMIGRQEIGRLLRAWRVLKDPHRSLLIEMMEGHTQQQIKRAAAISRSSSQPAGHHHQ